MRVKINPVGVFPKVASEICITAVGCNSPDDSVVFWYLADENNSPLVHGESIVGPEAHQNWGTANPEIVMDLTLAKLGLTRAQ